MRNIDHFIAGAAFASGERQGDIFDPNNACLDGGVCDVNSIHPVTAATGDGFFVRSVAMSMGGLRMAIARVQSLGASSGLRRGSLGRSVARTAE